MLMGIGRSTVRVIVVNHLSLDGVIQSPGRPDEDARDGFSHGGWADPGNDPAMGAAIGERLGDGFAWLFGHRSYDDMLGHWNAVGGPFKDGLNGTAKYVATSHPDADLPWPNSTLLTGDVPAAVAALRAQPGGNLVIMGSGQLIRSLLPHGLVDELFLMIHPVVIGSGRRLFGPDDTMHRLRLVAATPTDTGVLLTTYRLHDQLADQLDVAADPPTSG
jgi:dihydrofolate reductase